MLDQMLCFASMMHAKSPYLKIAMEYDEGIQIPIPATSIPMYIPREKFVTFSPADIIHNSIYKNIKVSKYFRYQRYLKSRKLHKPKH